MKKTANIIFFILMYLHKPYFNCSSNFEVKENNVLSLSLRAVTHNTG